MFDTYYDQHITREITKNVNITEKRAPTDESLKLLEEMREKSLKSIVGSVSTTNNTLSAACIAFENPVNYETVYIVKFVLNGKEYQVKTKLDNLLEDKKEHLDKVYKNLCEQLAQEIMQPVFKEMNDLWRWKK